MTKREREEMRLLSNDLRNVQCYNNVLRIRVAELEREQREYADKSRRQEACQCAE